MNIFLHIGLYKTGTTAIQRFLSLNRDQLVKQGFLYPSIGVYGDAHYPISWGLNKSHPQYSRLKQKVPGFIKEITREARSRNCQNVILSAETFSDIGDLSEVVKALKNHKIKIVVYLRRQDNHFHALYCQRVVSKERLATQINEVLETQWENYFHYHSRLLSVWPETFGKENILVNIYEQAQWSLGIYESFLQVLGVQKCSGFVEPGRLNASLPADCVEIIRLCNNRLDMSNRERGIFKQLLADGLGGEYFFSSFPGRSLLSDSSRKDILKRFEDFNGNIAKTYLGLSDINLFHDDWFTGVENKGKLNFEEAEDAIILSVYLWLQQCRKQRSNVGFLRKKVAEFYCVLSDFVKKRE